MCLAVPMEIVQLLPDNKAVVRQGKVTLEADVSLLREPRVGDYTIIHAGFALEKMEEDEAAEQLGRWELLQSEEEDTSGCG
ncbi:MAG: HypC/HybG/HupF family hydrogenase formation chaperone [Spirochaetia bacterium]